MTGRVQSKVPVYCVIANTAGEGHGDYDAIATAFAPDAESRFRILCDSLPRRKDVAMRLIAMQAKGLFQTQDVIHIPVADDGSR